MNIINRLTFRHLRLNRNRTLISIAGIMLSVAMITAVTGFVESTRDMMRRTYISGSGDWHVIIYNVTEQQAERIASDLQVESSYTEYDSDGKLNVYFRIIKPTRKYEQTANNIAARCEIEPEYIGYNKELLATEGIIAGDSSLSMVMYIAAVLILVIMGGSVIVIANAFYISATERIRQFGQLKSAGATKKQIHSSVLAEGLMLSLIGIPCGILLGFLVELAALAIANYLLTDISRVNNNEIYFRMIPSALPVITAALLSFITILLSAWFPARKCSKVSAIDAIRLSGEIKIRPKDVKASRIIKKIFGFEGTLAQKALGRNKRKYRATVISLVVSVILFVTGYGFGQQIEKTTDYYYPDYGINSYAFIIGKYTEEYRNATDRILAIENADTERSYSITVKSDDIEQFISDKAKKVFYNASGDVVLLKIHSLTDNGYAKLCSDLSIPSDTHAILVNRTYLETKGKTAEVKPFNFTKGMTLKYGEKNENSITIDAQTDIIPRGIIGMFSGNHMNIVIPESTMDFSTDGRACSWIVANAEDSAYFCEEAHSIIMEITDPDAAYDVQDIELMVSLNKNISLLITIFIMGFVGLLSLIAVTSVVSTISAGMALRTQEFAMLSSVGMAPDGFKRMLNLESLFYGLKALIIGLPLGLLASYLIYLAIGISFEYPFIWPWQSMAISAVAVFLLTFATMRYSRSKMKKVSIVEALRNETA